MAVTCQSFQDSKKEKREYKKESHQSSGQDKWMKDDRWRESLTYNSSQVMSCVFHQKHSPTHQQKGYMFVMGTVKFKWENTTLQLKLTLKICWQIWFLCCIYCNVYFVRLWLWAWNGKKLSFIKFQGKNLRLEIIFVGYRILIYLLAQLMDFHIQSPCGLAVHNFQLLQVWVRP